MIKINGIISYVNQVVSLHTRSFDCGYDTNYYAMVWDWKQLEPIEVWYRSTIGSNYDNEATIDADKTTLAAYNIYKHNKKVNSDISQKLDQTTFCPKVGYTVIVVAGRLVKKGTIAVVQKVYQTNYGPKCILVDDLGNEYKTYLKNIEIVAVPINEFRAEKRQEYSLAMLALRG